jgi:hypothetical protein
MSRYRRLCPILLLAAVGCAPEGPADFYRETLQARSEFGDSLTFIVDEPSAVRRFPPAMEILKRRTDSIRDSFEAWSKKTEVPGGFNKLMSEQFKPTMIGAERKADMLDSLVAYQDFCKNISYVNARISRELKRLMIVYQASLVQKIESGGRVGGNDFPGLNEAIDKIWKLREAGPPRLFTTGMTKEALDKFLPPNTYDTDLMTRMDPADVFKNDPNVVTPPPPERSAQVANGVERMADRIAKLPNQLAAGSVIADYKVDYPQPLVLKNESGKTLRNVAGILVVRVAGEQTERWNLVNFPEWKAEAMPTTVTLRDNPTQMRLLFEAEVDGGGTIGYDGKLASPTPPKRQ